MRGKRLITCTDRVAWGLIPAHAGKTQAIVTSRQVGRAHPRACGENKASPRKRTSALGSSPRMRGKRKIKRSRAHNVRLIPAHAGKTGNVIVDISTGGAHPRACGENAKRSHGTLTPFGSSPRMRGKLADREEPYATMRLIPAHAGKTLNDLEF